MGYFLHTTHGARAGLRPFRGLLSRYLVFLVLACAVSPFTGCGASLQQKKGQEFRSASLVENLIRVPLTRQTSDYTCGVAVMQSILYYLDEKDDYSEEILIRELKADPVNGTSYQAMADFARSNGYRVEVRTEMRLDDLRDFIDKGEPVIVLIQAWAESPVDYSRDWEDGHYVVAIGYDRDNVYFMDPSTLGNYTYLPNREFLDRWHDEDARVQLNHFGMIITMEGRERSYEPDRLHRIR
jgi:predicted double-glycine peptidase